MAVFSDMCPSSCVPVLPLREHTLISDSVSRLKTLCLARFQIKLSDPQCSLLWTALAVEMVSESEHRMKHSMAPLWNSAHCHA